jgi:hypothetical protein
MVSCNLVVPKTPNMSLQACFENAPPPVPPCAAGASPMKLSLLRYGSEISMHSDPVPGDHCNSNMDFMHARVGRNMPDCAAQQHRTTVTILTTATNGMRHAYKALTVQSLPPFYQSPGDETMAIPLHMTMHLHTKPGYSTPPHHMDSPLRPPVG